MICGPVDPGGTSHVCPGFNGALNVTPDRGFYTASVTVNASRPRAPFPSPEWTEAAFEFNLMWTSAIVSYVGIPIMGVILGCGNPSTILLMSGILRAENVGTGPRLALTTVNTTLTDIFDYY